MSMSTVLELADIADSDNTLSSYKQIDPDHCNTNNQELPQSTASMFQARPTSHHKLATFSCIFCCCPVGISAFVYSYKARRAKDNGDFKLAERYSKSAKELAIASIALGIFMLLIGGLIAGILFYTI
ncbi:hypothetical protein LOTGIDRAFT_152722 [Lottia gigantea]|uniref:Uncharacterized protein n=1 Tax=Lottia gigantea TaxID=225164 RepID=V4AUY3_LOTGI|nr:hypothetical protein LOTGIDRAFT_152722 [Lottia gigantea]ESO97631.1 hypothetical protein LOTGIDRAFT_152722 [Lottia gigantea]